MTTSKNTKGTKKASQDAFWWWNEQSTFVEGDSLRTKFKKVLLRVSGILLLIIFSPALLLALIIAFLVAL